MLTVRSHCPSALDTADKIQRAIGHHHAKVTAENAKHVDKMSD